jgi:coatomer subunit beta'
MEKLARLAQEKGMYDHLNELTFPQGKNNIAFICYFLLRKIDECLNLLCDTGRIPEAAFLARTYAPRYLYLYLKQY